VECSSGKVGHYNLLGSIADSWDAIVEAALWFQGHSSDMGQYSSTTSTTSLITDDSTDEEDQLDEDSMNMTSSSSIHAPSPELKKGEILIFNGKEYVPIEPPSVPQPHCSPSHQASICFSLSPLSPEPTSDPSVSGEQTGNLVYYYERKTNKPDPWGYADANTWFVYAYGNDSTPILQPGLAKLPPPPGHPAWCAQNGIPVVRYHFTTEFQGL
jgi:hypothetical protein